METYVELNRPEGIGEVSPATNLVGNIFSGHWHLRSISCHILASSKEAVMLLTLVRVKSWLSAMRMVVLVEATGLGFH